MNRDFLWDSRYLRMCEVVVTRNWIDAAKANGGDKRGAMVGESEGLRWSEDIKAIQMRVKRRKEMERGAGVACQAAEHGTSVE